MAKNEKEFKENAEIAVTLEKKEQELAKSSNKGLLHLTEMQLKQVNELNDLLVSYTRQRARVMFQLNSIRREITEGKKSYAELERFSLE